MQLLHAERSFLLFLHLLRVLYSFYKDLDPSPAKLWKTSHDLVQLEIIKDSTSHYKLDLTRNNNHIPQEQLKQASKDLLIFFSFKKKVFKYN